MSYFLIFGLVYDLMREVSCPCLRLTGISIVIEICIMIPLLIASYIYGVDIYMHTYICACVHIHVCGGICWRASLPILCEIELQSSLDKESLQARKKADFTCFLQIRYESGLLAFDLATHKCQRSSFLCGSIKKKRKYGTEGHIYERLVPACICLYVRRRYCAISLGTDSSRVTSTTAKKQTNNGHNWSLSEDSAFPSLRVVESEDHQVVGKARWHGKLSYQLQRIFPC